MAELPEPTVQPEPSPAAEPTASPVTSAPQVRVVVDPNDGTTYQVTDDEYKSLADLGFAHLRAKRATPSVESKSEPEAKTSQSTPDDDNDPIARQFSEMRKQVEDAHKTISELKTAREKDQAETAAERKRTEDQKYYDRLAEKYRVNQVQDQDFRHLVELKAHTIYNTAVQERRPISFEQAYADAAKESGKLLSDKLRNYIDGKVQVMSTAAEAPGGAAATAAMTPPKLPESKAEQRKLAQEFDDGTITQRAHQRMRALMNTAAG